MKRFGLAVAGAAILALAACGDSGGGSGGGSDTAAHPVCKDVDSAAVYVEKFFEELATAAGTGKITPEQAQAATDKLGKAHAAAADKPKGWYCTQIDEVKKELGL